MGWKSILKGLDSRPTTPTIGSVPLPDSASDVDAMSLKSKRPRTPSLFKKSLFSSFRPRSPIVRTASTSTTSSTLSSLRDDDISPVTASDDDGSGDQYFRIAPDTPRTECVTPQPELPTRHPTPRMVPSRFATPKPRELETPKSPPSITPLSPLAVMVPEPSSIPSPVPQTASFSHSPPRPPMSARSSTPAPPRTQYDTPRQPRRASTPAPNPHASPNRSRYATTMTSPQPNDNNALVPVNHFPAHAELHWQLLQYDPSRGKPRLFFNVAHEASLIRVFNKYLRPLMPDEKHKLAANVPLTEMIIRIAPLPLPAWDIRARRHDGGQLRCIDVFASIQESLYTPLSDLEKQQWAKDYLDSCDSFFKARCQASAALTDWEERQGLRRVDLLKGRTMFKGIARTPDKSYWVLHLDRER